MKADATTDLRQPTFQPIFGTAWDALPPVMRAHYANRPYTQDVVTVEGVMEVAASPLMRLFAPLSQWTGLLVPHIGSNAPVTVRFRSEPESNAFCFDREFLFAGKKTYHFRSRMMPIGGNEVIEFMSLGIGWRAAYDFVGGKVTLSHRGYVWRVFGLVIPVPLHWLFGKGYAEEEATGEKHFRMAMEVRHPWFGQVYRYSGDFEVTEVSLAP